jgi:hypothetical protein
VNTQSIFVKIFGGLGNQMFQLACAYSLSVRNGVPIVLEVSSVSGLDKRALGHTPRSFGLSVFESLWGLIDKQSLKKRIRYGENAVLRLLYRYKQITIYKEKAMRFDPAIFQLVVPVFLEGYFQSEKYFNHCEPEIRSLFRFPEHVLFKTEYLNQISESTCPVSVHFRRGDFVYDNVFHENHGVCDYAYYQTAMNFIMRKFNTAHFFIFSDDISQIRSDIAHWELPMTFVLPVDSEPEWIDMMLMSKCRHHIIANSTYSWWAAWLSESMDKVVVAPQKWFAGHAYDTSDLIPVGWLRM